MTTIPPSADLPAEESPATPARRSSWIVRRTDDVRYATGVAMSILGIPALAGVEGVAAVVSLGSKEAAEGLRNRFHAAMGTTIGYVVGPQLFE
jgi:hypothetical protein